MNKFVCHQRRTIFNIFQNEREGSSVCQIKLIPLISLCKLYKRLNIMHLKNPSLLYISLFIYTYIYIYFLLYFFLKIYFITLKHTFKNA